MEIKIVAKVWETGSGSLIVTIPKNVVKLLRIEKGDYVNLEIEKFENEDTKYIDKQKRKQEISKERMKNNEIVL